MKNLHIVDSYNIWSTGYMKYIIKEKCLEIYNSDNPEITLNRTYRSMFIEWWLHNIGYYVTKLYCSNETIHAINLRCKDVDLNEWM